MELVEAGDHGTTAIDGMQAVPKPVFAIRFHPNAWSAGEDAAPGRVTDAIA